MSATLGDCPNCGSSERACTTRMNEPRQCCGPCLRGEVRHPVVSDTEWAWIPSARPTPRTTEGMLGSWSHCGQEHDHEPHRHRIVLNEGVYENVLCLGTPGDPEGYAPPVRLQY